MVTQYEVALWEYECQEKTSRRALEIHFQVNELMPDCQRPVRIDFCILSFVASAAFAGIVVRAVSLSWVGRAGEVR